MRAVKLRALERCARAGLNVHGGIPAGVSVAGQRRDERLGQFRRRDGIRGDAHGWIGGIHIHGNRMQIGLNRAGPIFNRRNQRKSPRSPAESTSSATAYP